LVGCRWELDLGMIGHLVCQLASLQTSPVGRDVMEGGPRSTKGSGDKVTPSVKK
jgi:hypothetical protein